MLEDCRGLAVIGQARTMPLCVHALLSLRNAFAGRALHRQHWLGDARRKLQLLIGSCSVGAVRDVKSCAASNTAFAPLCCEKSIQLLASSIPHLC